MRNALSQGDYELVGKLCHTIKSSSQNVGAVKLSGFCLELEADIRRRRYKTAPLLLEAIEAEFARVQAELKPVLDTVAENGPRVAKAG